jgi:DNA adenine methylase
MSGKLNGAINSPFRYAGGKFYARKLIIDHIPEHSTYIEPFAGGASIFFAKPKVENNILNDLDSELVNTYLHIRDFPNELIKELDGEKALKERHKFYKNEYKPKNDLQRAKRWYYLNRTSYSGIMNMKNCYWGYGEKFSMRPENWGRNILRTSKKLQGVNLTQIDFEEVIDNAPNDSFLFVDPPYYNADQDKFYECFFTLEDHLRLREVLRRNSDRLKFMITYDNSQEVWDLYDWAQEIHEKEWNYAISRTDDQKKVKTRPLDEKGTRPKGKEIFILNYADPKPSEEQLLFEFDSK